LSAEKIHVTDIESAINWWRERSPSPDGISACTEVRALAEVYALLVYYHETECDENSMPPRRARRLAAWYETTPDAPCIAICSTSQGDDLCKGCGRTFDEVQHWPALTPSKSATWRRITMEGTAWRFNRYAKRALEDPAPNAMLESIARAIAKRAVWERQRCPNTAQHEMTHPLAHPAAGLARARRPDRRADAFSTIDTVLMARASALDLAAWPSARRPT
jgi:predicted Fe-S protein YdhL (DUF1289 family)